MASAEHEPITGVWELCLQRGSGAEPGLYYLLTTPDPDRRMWWCRDFWWKKGYEKSCNCSDIAYLARSANLPNGLYILTYVISFFLLLLSSFLMISRTQIISRSAGPIFTIFTSNESVLGVDDRSGPLFSISQGTMPWQSIFGKIVAKLSTPCTYRSVIPKRNGISSCGWAH